MALRLDLNKIKGEKAEYIKYLKTFRCEPAVGNKFPYKSYYENDPDVQIVRNEIAEKKGERTIIVSKPNQSPNLKDDSRHKENISSTRVKPDNYRVVELKNKLNEIDITLSHVNKLIEKRKNKEARDLLRICRKTVHSIESSPFSVQIQPKIAQTKSKITDSISKINLLFSLTHLHKLELVHDVNKFQSELQSLKVKINGLLLNKKDRTIIDGRIETITSNCEKRVNANKWSNFIKKLNKIENSCKTKEEALSLISQLKQEFDIVGFDESKKVTFRDATQRVLSSVQLKEKKKEHAKERLKIVQESHTPITPIPKKIEQTFIPQELEVEWNYVVFKDGYLEVVYNSVKLFRHYTNCKSSYNQIKEYLRDRLPKIVLVSTSTGGWNLKDPIVMKDALDEIRRKEAEDFVQAETFDKALKSFGKMQLYLEDSEHRELILRRLKEKKQKYLNYLIKLQLDKFRLIPAIEMIAHESSDLVYDEDVFIFSIPYKSYSSTSSMINIVYENINPARATIVCTVEERYYNDALQSLFNFMNDGTEKNKRSRLHQTIRLNQYVKNMHIVIHGENMHHWAHAIQH